MYAQALVRHLRFRLIAGIILALIGNSAAAAGNNNRNVEKFKAQTTAKQRTASNSSGNNISWVTLDFDDQPARPSPLQPPAQLQPAPPKPAVQVAPPTNGASTVPIAELDDATTGTYREPKCKECEEKAKQSLGNQINSNIKPIASILDQQTNKQSLKDKLAIAAAQQAVKTRPLAEICGGTRDSKGNYSTFRSGNRSKCMCAMGTKDALVESGLCPGGRPNPTPPYEDAVNMAGLPKGTTRQLRGTGPSPATSFLTRCPAFHQTKGRQTRSDLNEEAALEAPVGSVIVYSTTRHVHGHVETVIGVTKTNIAEMKKYLPNVRVGQKLYCSDFCSATPTFMGGTNWVEGIYSL